MAENANALIRRYLEDVIAAGKSFEVQLREFARDGDDDDVQTTFASRATETRRQYERLIARLDQLGGGSSNAASFLAGMFSPSTQIAQSGHLQEERTAQKLITAFSIENGERAMYEVLAVVAKAAGDTETEALAREIQAEAKQTAERIVRFIPSRSKIAFNMLTVHEIDPSVETKAPENRIT